MKLRIIAASGTAQAIDQLNGWHGCLVVQSICQTKVVYLGKWASWTVELALGHLLCHAMRMIFHFLPLFSESDESDTRVSPP